MYRIWCLEKLLWKEGRKEINNDQEEGEAQLKAAHTESENIREHEGGRRERRERKNSNNYSGK